MAHEQGDVGRDRQTRLAISSSQARTGTGKSSFSNVGHEEKIVSLSFLLVIYVGHMEGNA